MHPAAVVVSSLDQVGVDRRLVRLDALDELFDLEHQRARESRSREKITVHTRPSRQSAGARRKRERLTASRHGAVWPTAVGSGSRAAHSDHRLPNGPSKPADALASTCTFPGAWRSAPYCDFVSYASTAPAIDHRGYADAVLRELDARAPASQDGGSRASSSAAGRPSLGARASSAGCSRRVAARAAASGRARSRSPSSATRRRSTRTGPARSLDAGRESALDRRAVARRDERLRLPRAPARPEGGRDGRPRPRFAAGVPRVSRGPHLRAARASRPRTRAADEAPELARPRASPPLRATS